MALCVFRTIMMCNVTRHTPLHPPSPLAFFHPLSQFGLALTPRLSFSSLRLSLSPVIAIVISPSLSPMPPPSTPPPP